MQILKYLLIKEFKQIFRNKSILPVIFVSPMMQLLILPLAADYEIKNINLAIIAEQSSTESRRLVEKIQSSGYFKVVSNQHSIDVAQKLMEDDKADLILILPYDFETELTQQKAVSVSVLVNAINGVKAGVGNIYLNRILMDYSTTLRELNLATTPSLQSNIEVRDSYWYNPFLVYSHFMVPGILVLLVTMIGAYLTALNIVKEKELGTIEQINVSPIKKYQFILGKLIPFWLIGQFVFTVGLFLVAEGVYGVIPLGNVGLLYFFLSIYLLAVLGLGLLISTYTQTQQQAMSLAFFFLMIFILLGGLFTAIESMPTWARTIAQFNPISYFIEVMRMVVMKGSTFKDLMPHFGIMTLFAIVINSWAMWNYRKQN